MKALKYILILTVYFSLTIATLYSQPSIQFQKTYNSPFNRDEGFRSICDAGNGNYFVSGYCQVPGGLSAFYIIKINPYGDTIWTKIIGGRNLSQGAEVILPTNDGGCIFTGSNDTAFTMKLDSIGNQIWYKTYPVSGSFQYTDIYDFINTSDGGYIMCGKIFGQVACVYKIDGFGNLHWYKTFTSSFRKDFKRIREVGNNFYCTGIHMNSVKDITTSFMKLSNIGDSIWEKFYKAFDNFIIPTDIISQNQNLYLFGTGFNSILSKDINLFLKLDTSGVRFDSVFISSQFSKNDQLRKICKVNENKFILASQRSGSSGGDTTFAVAKVIDSLGNVLNFKGFDGYETSSFFSVTRTQNNDYLFVGFASKFTQNDFDGYIVRTDSNLNSTVFAIDPLGHQTPVEFKLYQNHPNPFNPSTKIKFDISKDGFVTLKVFDILGKEMFSVNEFRASGSHSIQFNDANYASGMYFYQLESGNYKETKKMVLVK